jgi:hypothetical protein
MTVQQRHRGHAVAELISCVRRNYRKPLSIGIEAILKGKMSFGGIDKAQQKGLDVRGHSIRTESKVKFQIPAF